MELKSGAPFWPIKTSWTVDTLERVLSAALTATSCSMRRVGGPRMRPKQPKLDASSMRRM